MPDIKKVITDFVSFDVANDYYDEEKKEELTEMLKEILFEDDIIVRKFLEKFFNSAEESAKSFGLIANIGDADTEEVPEEEPVEEPIEDEEPTEEPEVPEEEPTEENPEEEDENKSESILRAYRDAASSLLYE